MHSVQFITLCSFNLEHIPTLVPEDHQVIEDTWHIHLQTIILKDHPTYLTTDMDIVMDLHLRMSTMVTLTTLAILIMDCLHITISRTPEITVLHAGTQTQFLHLTSAILPHLITIDQQPHIILHLLRTMGHHYQPHTIYPQHQQDPTHPIDLIQPTHQLHQLGSFIMTAAI